MRSPHSLLPIAAAILICVAPFSVQAQLAIQQPAFGVNSTATTVSVPDRGRAHLGGIGRAGESRTSTGPFRSGSSYGQFRDGSSTSVSVTIHDFEEMDRTLLSQPSRSNASPPLQSGDDYRDLLSRNQRRGVALAASKEESPLQVRTAKTMPEPSDDRRFRERSPSKLEIAQRAARFFESGVKAEERGADGVAKVHYRLAAKYGHEAAAQRLAALVPGSDVDRGGSSNLTTSAKSK